MKSWRLFGLLIIAAHWAAAVWHFVLLAKIFPTAPKGTDWLPIVFVSAVHLGLSVLWWTVSIRLAGWVLLVLLSAAMGAGVYEHFLGPGPNTIFRVPSTNWTAAFRASVFVLLVLEILGCWLGFRSVRSKATDKEGSANLPHATTMERS